MGKKVDITFYNHYDRDIPEEFDNYKILVMSDLHSNEIDKDNEAIIKAVNETEPDAVFIAGDMFSDNAKNMDVTYRLIEKLAQSYEIYYGCGNHELKLGLNERTRRRYQDYRRKLRHAGVHYLNNKSEYIVKGNGRIKVTGLNITRKYFTKIWNKKRMPENYIEGCVGSAGNDYNILIAHNPVYFNNYARWGADIVLSGHIHGGMIVLPFIGGIISPSFELFPHYDFGRFTAYPDNNKKSILYLTRGLGSHTIPVRINNKPEIMLITLKKDTCT